jgi:hypothetical protein
VVTAVAPDAEESEPEADPEEDSDAKVGQVGGVKAAGGELSQDTGQSHEHQAGGYERPGSEYRVSL